MSKRRTIQRSENTSDAVNDAVKVAERPQQEGIAAEAPASAQPAPRGKPKSPFKIAVFLWLLPLAVFILITVIKTSMGS